VQILHWQPDDFFAFLRPPDIARHAANEVLTTVADFQERLFALTAVVGHLIFSTPARRRIQKPDRPPGSRVPIRAVDCASELAREPHPLRLATSSAVDAASPLSAKTFAFS
jgi:hypothetical protein